MSELFNYTSIYAPYFKSFIKMKQDKGFNVLRIKWIFLEFDKFIVSVGAADLFITSNLIDQWRKTRINDGQRTIYAKYSVWSQFCKHMCHLGHECYIPRLPKSPAKNSFTPYIFTHQQMEDIFKFCDSLRLYDRHMSTILFVIPTVIRLLYGTGMRVSEALSLKNEDIDLENHCITLRKTKNGEQRLAPLSDSLQKILEQYTRNRNKMPLPKVNDPKGYFFISPNGSFCRAQTVYCWFRKVLDKCGIPHIGNHHGPRVHDLRHTFAVHSLMKMAKSGLDLYYTLPVLSTYLGHKSIDSTEQYIRLTQEMYPELLKDERNLCSHIFPQIKTDNNGNNEILMAVRFDEFEGSNNYFRNMYIIGSAIPTNIDPETRTKIGAIGGGSNNIVVPTDYVRSIYSNNDQRKEATFYEIYTNNDQGGKDYYTSIVTKGSGIVLGGSRQFKDDIILYRYGDVLLMIAEAKNALGQDPSNEINEIRMRAYDSDFPNHTFVSGSQSENDEAILEERLREMAFEGKRWWDLIRFGKALEYLPTLENQAHMLLWPISSGVLSLENKVNQNPGY